MYDLQIKTNTSSYSLPNVKKDHYYLLPLKLTVCLYPPPSWSVVTMTLNFVFLHSFALFYDFTTNLCILTQYRYKLEILWVQFQTTTISSRPPR